MVLTRSAPFFRQLLEHRTLHQALSVMMFAGALVVAWKLVAVLLVAAQGAMTSDAPIYFAMGRGLLNGLKVYTDLFESKPPGIFLLTALSLLITGDERLLLALQLVLYFAVPVGALWLALSRSRSMQWETRLLAGGWAFSAAGLLTLYLIERSEPLQTESIGAVFACGYVLTALHWRESGGRMPVALCGLLALAAIGMKEPFVVAVLSTALLISTTRVEFVRLFVRPIVFVVIGGAVILVFLGAGWDYLSVYLPVMLGGRVGGVSAEPLLVRGFAIAKVLNDLIVENESNPLLGSLIGMLWIAFPSVQSGITSIRKIVASGLAVVMGYFSMVSTWQLIMLSLVMARRGASFFDPFYWLVATKTVGLWVVFAGLWWFVREKGARRAILVTLPVWYLTSFAVALADLRPTHLSVAVPVYFALIVLFVSYVVSQSRGVFLIGVVSLVCLASALSYDSSRLIDQLRTLSRFTFQSQRVAVEELDAVLDRCGHPPYFAVSAGLPVMGFARHSPVGPLFIDQIYLRDDHPLVRETQRRFNEQARVLIVPPDAEQLPEFDHLRNRFHPNPPACARSVLIGTGPTLWFHK